MTPADRSARAAHRIAFLLAKHGDELARHIRRMVRDDDSAQDILQDTMIRAHRALSRLAAGSNERAWLYRIATNTSLNHLRSQTREREALRRHAAERETAVAPHAILGPRRPEVSNIVGGRRNATAGQGRGRFQTKGHPAESGAVGAGLVGSRQFVGFEYCSCRPWARG